MGPALVPDKPIYRKNAEGEFYVYFSKDTVRRAAELYLQQGRQTAHTLEHEHAINGLTVVESWLVEDKDKDKSAVYDLDVPVGTWMVAVKVENEAIWQDWVKEGKVKGFSIEGYFADKMQKQEEDRDGLRRGGRGVERVGDGDVFATTRTRWSTTPSAASSSTRRKATNAPHRRARFALNSSPSVNSP